MIRLVLALLALARLAGAHGLEPSLLELQERDGGRVAVTWSTPAARIPGIAVRPQLPPSCRDVAAPSASEHEDRIVARWTVDCGAAGLVGQRVGVTGLAAARSEALVRVALADGRMVQRVVTGAAPWLDVPARPKPLDVVRDYVALGVHHILGGWDHLLFVLGLLLLVGGGQPLLATITAFTVGHSVTLSLAVLGVVHVPQQPVEVAIAGSVFLLAVELAREEAHRPPSLLARRPWLMAFGFGLLHGLGFAGALAEVGLPASDIPLALGAFNVGIELGQLGVVLTALIAARLGRGAIARLPPWAHAIPAWVIGSLSAYWVLDRAAALLR